MTTQVQWEQKHIRPYVKGMAYRIRKLLARYNVETIFKPNNKISQCLRPVKDKIDLHTPCRFYLCTCVTWYVGKSRRSISITLKEHTKQTEYLVRGVSAVAKHSIETKDTTGYDITEVTAAISWKF